MDLYFSCASLLDGQDLLLFREKIIIFGKVEVAAYFVFILKGKNKKENPKKK